MDNNDSTGRKFIRKSTCKVKVNTNEENFGRRWERIVKRGKCCKIQH